MTTNTIILYLLAINTITFITFGIDKYKAYKNKQRISEKTLHSVSAIGGFAGAIFGMFFSRHKIKKLKFILIEIGIFIFWITIFYLIANN